MDSSNDDLPPLIDDASNDDVTVTATTNPEESTDMHLEHIPPEIVELLQSMSGAMTTITAQAMGENGEQVLQSIGVDPQSSNVVFRRRVFRPNNEEEQPSSGDESMGNNIDEASSVPLHNTWAQFSFTTDGNGNGAQDNSENNNDDDDDDDNVDDAEQTGADDPLTTLLNLMSQDAAFQPLNVPNPPMFFQRQHQQGQRNRLRDQSGSNTQRRWSLRNPCAHENKFFERPVDVPVKVCEHCDCVVAPESAHSVVAKSTPLPHSMRKDRRWTELLQLHAEHQTALERVDAMLRHQEHLLVRIYQWRDAFTNSQPVDYQAQDNPVFRELERSVKRVVNVTTGFQDTVKSMLIRHRSSLLRNIGQAIPQNSAEFVESMKRAVKTAMPRPLLHPTAGATCAVCNENKVFVRLHCARDRFEESPIESVLLQNRRRRRQRIPPCLCAEFSTCFECLLEWYWEKTDGLEKTFATCPSCRAEFRLEDIVPVYTPATATVQSEASAS